MSISHTGDEYFNFLKFLKVQEIVFFLRCMTLIE